MTPANQLENDVIDEPQCGESTSVSTVGPLEDRTYPESQVAGPVDEEQIELRGTWPHGMSDDWQQAQQVRRTELLESVLAYAVGLIGYVVLALFLAQPLDRLMTSYWSLGDAAWIRLSVMSLIVFVVHQASSAIVPPVLAMFGFSRETTGSHVWQMFRQSDMCAKVGIVLGFAFVAALWTLVSLAVFWAIWLVGSGWWLVAAAAFFLSDSVKRRSWLHFLAADLEPLDDELHARFERRAREAGVSVQKFYRISDSSDCGWTGAMVGGRGRNTSVLFGGALLDQFTPDELEVVLMHELGHVKFRDEYSQMALNLMLCIASFWLIDSGVQAYLGAGSTYTQFPVWTLPLMLLLFWLLEFVRGPITNFMGRFHETRCDRYALKQTDNPEAYLSAYRKLAELNGEPADSRWWQTLASEHPPMTERLALAAE